MTRRRSRVRRERQGKSVALTGRDLEIFAWLKRYRYLRSTYLHAFAGGRSQTRFKERLGDLFHEGFIDRPERQWAYADARCQPVLYEAAERSEKLLREERPLSGADARTFLGATAHRQFAHSVMLCACLASIELATLAVPGVRFVPWGEILGRAPERTQRQAAPFRLALGDRAVVPDGIFGLEYRLKERKTYRFFALEADRGTEPIMRADKGQTSLLGKVSAYQAAFERNLHRTELGLPNLLVLLVTLDEVRLGAIARSLPPCGAVSSFLLKSVDPAALMRPVPTLFAEPWARAGLPPVDISSRA